MKQLSTQVSDDEMRYLKIMAALRESTIREIVADAIESLWKDFQKKEGSKNGII